MEHKIFSGSTWGKVRDLSQEGEGIVALKSPDPELDGRVAFIPGLIPGDVIEAEEITTKGKRVRVDRYQLLELSQDRQEAFCEHFPECGGCQLQEMKYEASLRWKTKRVADSLTRIAKLDYVEDILEPCQGLAEPYGFRSIVQLRNDREARLGFYRRGSKQVLAQNYCPIQSEAFNEIRDYLHTLLRQLVSSELVKLEQIEMRQDAAASNFLLHFDFNAPIITDDWQDLMTQLIDFMTETYGPESLSLWLEDPEYIYHPYGETKLICHENGLELRYSANSFQQTNIKQNAVLYREICKFAELALIKRKSSQCLDYKLGYDKEWDNNSGTVTTDTDNLKILELYSGVGSISLNLAKALPQAQVLGVEINRQAVLDSLDNAALNWLPEDRVCFKHQDAARYLHCLIKKEQAQDFDLLVVDPPRQGLGKELCQDIVVSGIDHVLYVSCDPASLARDIAQLNSAYRLERVQPIDMFPWMTHV
ncbi:MAG: methyltransferase domain-containing protein, partial [Eubacteriales bacterium]|nr:methyltransferase domain-containing protein [Eubacteriales bacterium]